MPVASEIPSFEIGQKVVVFNELQQILFLRRSPLVTRPGGWDFPGGGLEHEDPLDGLRREAREEAAIEIEDIKPLTLVSHPQGENEPWLVIVGYAAQLKSGQVTLSWEHDEYRWLSISEAEQLDLPTAHKTFLSAAIKTVASADLL